MNPEEEKNVPEEEPNLVELMAMRGGPMAGDELTPQEAENLKNQKITEELIVNLAQLYVKQGFSADIEQARCEASEAIKKSKAERLKSHNHTEELIEQEAQRYMREGFYTGIEEARSAAREAMWPFA